MKYANGACCPWIPRERETNDEYCYDDVDFVEQQLKHQRQQAQMPAWDMYRCRYGKNRMKERLGFKEERFFMLLINPFSVMRGRADDE